jgi:3-dehydroquinate dehydratase / shikimate dehydrogenase
MLAGVITEKTPLARKMQIARLVPYVQGLEIRFDLTGAIADDEMKSYHSLPLIFTVRSKKEGGAWRKGEEERLSFIEKICAFEPDFVDLEWDLSDDYWNHLVRSYPKIKWVISSHHFTKGPHDIETLFACMQKEFPCLYKIAATPAHSLEVMQMLLFSKKHPNLSMIPMGKSASWGRLLGSYCDNPIDYCHDGMSRNSLGQISAKRMQTVYHFSKQSKQTKIFALIGNPIDQSVGHLFHNHYFFSKGYDAVYLKIPLEKKEIIPFLQKAQQLPIYGFSVTAPLKQEISASAAINTLTLQGGKYQKENTDGKGCLDLFPIDLKDKTVMILGAGGAAMGIAKEAYEKGAKIYVWNRTFAHVLPMLYQYKAIFSFPDRTEYDLLIQTTSFFLPSWIKEKKIVIDINQKPKWTPFLKIAKKKKCLIFFGRQMFIKQAFYQQKIWKPLFSESHQRINIDMKIDM